MLCSNCRTEIAAGSKFCSQCGALVNRRCEKCGAESAPGGRFCAQCGTQLTGRGAGPPSNRGESTKVSVIDALNSDLEPTSLDGERKTVTVLSADIKGSMDLMEDIDPEEAGAIFDPAIKLMIDAAHRFGGYVVQSTGDGIFALFGAPVAHEDHPQRALHAALRMQEDIRRYSARLRSEGKPPLQARIGANTGEVVVRTIRTDDEHTEYTPIGHSASLASRLQALAPIGSIAISGAMQKLVDGYFGLKSLGPTKIKGVTETVNVYEVTGLGPLRTKLQRAAIRGYTKFVGRDREMQATSSAAEQAKQGHGQIVAAVAEPGVGKSRLFYEFKVRYQRGWTVMEAFSVSHGKANPYAPLIDLMSSYFGIEISDDPRRRREKVSGRIYTLDRSLEDALPYLFGLLGIVEGDDPLAQTDGQTWRRRTFDAIKRIMMREARDQPLMVIFEDLHWIDGETQALLNLLADSIGAARVLLLVNYRPEYRHEWGNQSSYTQLRLEPLGQESAAEMLTALIGDTREVQPLRRQILETAGGNPFFMEETVQALFEEGALIRDGEIKTAASPAHLRIPPTVQAILASRIDRLPVDEKQLLQTLAIIGKQFPLSLAREVTAQPDETLGPMLTELEKREFIFEQLSANDIEYSFKHALTQEVALNSMLSERQRSLHERTARAMESLYAERLEDHLNELAHHYQRAGNAYKAVEYLNLAGQQAGKRAAYVEAVANLSTGLDLLTKLPETLERDRYELALQFALGPSLMETKGDAAPETQAAYARAMELSQRVGDDQQTFWAQGGLFLHYMVGGQFKTAHTIGSQLLDLAQSSDDSSKRMFAHGMMGIILFWTGDLALAHSHFEQSASLFDAPRQRHLAVIYGMDVATGVSGYAAWALWMLGYPEQALERIKRTLLLAQERGHHSSTTMALHHAAAGYALRREARIAKKFAEEGLALSNEHGFALWKAFCTFQLGKALAQSGEVTEGIALMKVGAEASVATGAKNTGPTLGPMAEACGQVGQTMEAVRLIAAALTAENETGEAAFEPELHRIKGEVLLAQDAAYAPEAELCFRTAIEHSRKRDAKSWELRATTSMARLLSKQGHREEARAMLAEIYNWFTEGFDTADLKDAKALLEQLGA